MMRTLRPALLSALVAGVMLSTACPGPDWPKCENDDHCKSDKEGNTSGKDLMCVFGQCQECAKDKHCGAGEVCRSYRCVPKPECDSDTDCDGNKVCQAGKCKIECTTNAECGSGQSCRENRCIAGAQCAEDADCPEGQSCVDGSCQGGMAGAGGCSLQPRILFDFNMASITSEARATLDENARCMKENASWNITIEGHCDDRGTAEYNLALGERRAGAAKKYMQKLGVSGARMKTISYGEEQPLNSGSNEGAWSENRRAEFKMR